MISIVIPAHNEEKVIARTLQPLVQGVAEGWLEVIVVCNGCTDKTKEIVSDIGGAIKFIETPVPSKTNALNLGDSMAKGFPRIYQDADVVLTLEAVRQVASVLQQGQFLAAAPTMQMETLHASWAVRSYYDVWQKLPYVREGMIGTGVYALSQKGRSRFDSFPQIIADDGYVRALFTKHERVSVNSAHVLVRSPTTLEGLLKIKTRSRMGRQELKEKFPELLLNEEKKYGNALIMLILKVHCWLKIPVYMYVNIVTRLRARKQYQSNGFTGWERDDTSRESTIPSDIS